MNARAFAIAFACALLDTAASQAGVWDRMPSAGMPIPGSWPATALAWHPTRRVLIHAGGATQRGTIHEAAAPEFHWREAASANLIFSCAAHDPQTDLVVILSHHQLGYRTHTWNGRDLLPLGAAGIPVEANVQGIVFDPIGQTLLAVAARPVSGMTHAWNGSSWTLVGTAPVAPGIVANDPFTGEPILFTNDGISRRSWRWNGSAWLPGAIPPPPGPWTAACTDPLHHRVRVLQHGAPQRLWSWDGMAWREPQRLYGTAPDAGPTLMQATDHGIHAMSFRYREAPLAVASSQVLGTGCRGPRGVPTLVPTSLPLFDQPFTMTASNLPDTILDINLLCIGVPGGSLNGVPIPADLTRYGMPGCTAETLPWSVRPLFPVINPLHLSLQFGAAIELLGFPIVLQIATIAPGANAGNLVFSNGLLATFGTH